LFVCLLGVGMFSLVAPAAPASGASPSAKAGQAAPAPGDFAGGETCATCHEEVSKGFESNPHSKLAEAHGKTGVTCEGCHGPGKAHVDGGGDVTKIFNPAKASPKEVDEKCLTCHQGHTDTKPQFNMPFHHKVEEGLVKCSDCHDPHGTFSKKNLRSSSQMDL